MGALPVHWDMSRAIRALDSEDGIRDADAAAAGEHERGFGNEESPSRGAGFHLVVDVASAGETRLIEANAVATAESEVRRMVCADDCAGMEAPDGGEGVNQVAFDKGERWFGDLEAPPCGACVRCAVELIDAGEYGAWLKPTTIAARKAEAREVERAKYHMGMEPPHCGAGIYPVAQQLRARWLRQRRKAQATFPALTA